MDRELRCPAAWRCEGSAECHAELNPPTFSGRMPRTHLLHEDDDCVRPADQVCTDAYVIAGCWQSVDIEDARFYPVRWPSRALSTVPTEGFSAYVSARDHQAAYMPVTNLIHMRNVQDVCGILLFCRY